MILQLKRPEGNTRPTLRVLSALSRFDETPDELVIELTDAGYVSHGDVAAVAKMEAEAKIVAAAPATEDESVTFDELLGRTDEVSRTTGQKVVTALLASGGLRRNGTGQRGKAHRYWSGAATIDSARPMVQVVAQSDPGEGVIDSAQTPTLRRAESIPESLPANVIRIEDRRAPWEDEADPTVRELGTDFPLVADLAAGCVEPDTCAEVGACGEGGVQVVCRPPAGPAVQPPLDLPRIPWTATEVA